MSTTSFPAVLARTFGGPRGILGRIGAAVTGRRNGPTERHVVDVARLTPGEAVLVVGPGPAALAALAGTRHLVTVGPEAVASTGQPDSSVDVVLSVDNVQLWDDRAAGFAELRRVLRPGGRLLLSAAEKRLPVPRHALAAEVTAAGFTDLQTWTWQPPGLAPTTAELRALR
ncbi:class I SAM-dependent methyltransferase [Amycolatopsis acidicola]|uniref:Class I SAM-dependent methyltransferase n=1 Tax=Amycolatopsis acidicola TaxID=2596893 RepID=A0A5N0V1I3_9PSEU|nr:methyltransferase domain-containing protein [Amycolatopsis acidicola]KAA9158602.1 class I SAM-dependent methyltransferase [Amycolatopsis acidicola]